MRNINSNLQEPKQLTQVKYLSSHLGYFIYNFLFALILIGGLGFSQGAIADDNYVEDPSHVEEQDRSSIHPFIALFNVDEQLLPYPTDLYFEGTKDGTINMPIGVIASRPAGASVNQLDGFSTMAAITAPFSGPIDSTTLNADTVKLVQICLGEDTAPKACTGSNSPVMKVLVQGTDYSVAVANEADSNGTILQIKPIKPLAYSQGTIRRGYLVILTNGIRDTAGHIAHRDLGYDRMWKGLSQQHLRIAQSIGVNPSKVVETFSFTTQSVNDTFAILAQNIVPQAISVNRTPITSGMILGGGANLAEIYIGSVNVPYYGGVPSSTDPIAALTKNWVAAGPSSIPGIDPLSRNLTRFNPMPAPTEILTIPLFMSVPKSSVCQKPSNGYPVVIVQHGIGGNRTQAVTLSDAFARACFVVVAIDLPLHGITSRSNFFYQPGNERTFDLSPNGIPQQSPDGPIASSGSFFINLSSPLTSRDNTRQGEVDLMTLEKSLPMLQFTGESTPDIDVNKIHFVGLSLGSIVGGTHLSFSPNIKTATLSVPGGVISEIATESAALSPSINAAIQYLYGFVPGTTSYSDYLRDIQTVVDSADTVNHLKDALAIVPTVLVKVINDQVVPNSTTDHLIIAADLYPLCTAGQYPNISKGTGGYVTFLPPATHGSLFDPSSSLATTIEMQTQAVFFASSSIMTIFNPSVIDQTPCL